MFTLRGMEIKLHHVEPQKDNLRHLNDPFRQRVAPEDVLFPRKRGFMATVGDPETPDQDVFYICLRRLLLIQQPHSTATPLGQIRATNLPYYSGGDGGDDYRQRVLRFPLRLSLTTDPVSFSPCLCFPRYLGFVFEFDL